jgi:hypothetical protein
MPCHKIFFGFSRILSAFPRIFSEDFCMPASLSGRRCLPLCLQESPAQAVRDAGRAGRRPRFPGRYRSVRHRSGHDARAHRRTGAFWHGVPSVRRPDRPVVLLASVRTAGPAHFCTAFHPCGAPTGRSFSWRPCAPLDRSILAWSSIRAPPRYSCSYPGVPAPIRAPGLGSRQNRLFWPGAEQASLCPADLRCSMGVRNPSGSVSPVVPRASLRPADRRVFGSVRTIVASRQASLGFSGARTGD